MSFGRARVREVVAGVGVFLMQESRVQGAGLITRGRQKEVPTQLHNCSGHQLSLFLIPADSAQPPLGAGRAGKAGVRLKKWLLHPFAEFRKG